MHVFHFACAVMSVRAVNTEPNYYLRGGVPEGQKGVYSDDDVQMGD